MKTLFADTFYWAAMLNPRDQWHQAVRQFNQTIGPIQLVTTDEVLVEFLNFFAAFDTLIKQGAAQRVNLLLQSPMVQVVQQDRETLLSGLRLYEQRLDKGYSLTDCISMQTMKRCSISEVLTHDRHFTQEGFSILFE